MRRLAILCGLCLLMTCAAASGSIRSSPSTGSAVSEISATGLAASRLPQKARLARSSEQGRVRDATVKRTRRPRFPLILLGETAVEPRVGHNPAGTVAAFAFRARRSGTAASIHIYIGRRTRATILLAGLYSNRHGHPRTLLTSGSRQSPKAGGWSSVAVASARVRSGTTYWLAILGKGGAIYFRDRHGRSCAGKTSSKRRSRWLPGRWPARPTSHPCLISAYVKGARGTSAGGVSPPSSSGGSGGPGGSGAPVNKVQPYFAASTASGTTGACTAGCAIEGQRLSVTAGAWSNSPTSYSYQWQDCVTTAGTDTGVAVAGSGSSDAMTPPVTGSCVNATGPGATTNTYAVGSSDVGHALAVNVTATNGHGRATTTPAGSCNTGLMTTTWNAGTNLQNPPASTYFDNGQPGCSPISAVVGAGQYGTTSSGEHFCTNAPITCGFADIANAGVPQGAGLYAVPGTCTSPSGPGASCANTGTGWSYSRGVITLTSGAVLQNVSFVEPSGENSIQVGSSNNVTIQDSDISSACGCQFQSADGLITVTGSGSNVMIQNNNLHGLDASTAGHGCLNAIRGGAGTGSNIVVANNNIWFCGADLNGIEANGTWTIDDNYIHDMAWSDAAKSNHFDGIQTEGGGSSTSPLYFVNNTMLMDVAGNAAAPVILSDDFSPPTNAYRNIRHNLLAGGAWSLYVTGNASWPTTNSTFENNVFSQLYDGDHNTHSQLGSGNFGPTAYWTASTNVWTGNAWDDTGSTVPPSTQT